MQCQFRITESSADCTSVVCDKCGYSRACVKMLPFRRYCGTNDAAIKGTAGTQLKILLSWLGFVGFDSCKCNTRAMHMNAMGDDWCAENIETIVEWLKEEASNRGLPFISTIARMLVRRAIANSRKEASRGEATS